MSRVDFDMRCVDVGPTVEKKLGDLDVASPTGIVLGRAAQAVALFDRSACVEQCFYLLKVTGAHQHVQALICKQAQGAQ